MYQADCHTIYCDNVTARFIGGTEIELQYDSYNGLSVFVAVVSRWREEEQNVPVSLWANTVFYIKVNIVSCKKSEYR
jgi:hypothetical protein